MATAGPEPGSRQAVATQANGIGPPRNVSPGRCRGGPARQLFRSPTSDAGRRTRSTADASESTGRGGSIQASQLDCCHFFGRVLLAEASKSRFPGFLDTSTRRRPSKKSSERTRGAEISAPETAATTPKTAARPRPENRQQSRLARLMPLFRASSAGGSFEIPFSRLSRHLHQTATLQKVVRANKRRRDLGARNRGNHAENSSKTQARKSAPVEVSVRQRVRSSRRGRGWCAVREGREIEERVGGAGPGVLLGLRRAP